MESQGKTVGVTNVRITSRIQKIEESISCVEETKDTHTIVKKNTKKQKAPTQNIQEIQHTMKSLNLRIIGIQESVDSQLKRAANIFKKIIEKNS